MSQSMDPGGLTRPHDALDPHELLAVISSFRMGDFSVRMSGDYTGLAGKVADMLNDVIEINNAQTQELERVARLVGKEGKLRQRATRAGARGDWMRSIDAVNGVLDDLVQPTAEIIRVVTAVAQGDLSQSMALELEASPVRGEFLQTATTINTMVDQLRTFSGEVTRMAREVGTDGILGGKAEVPGAAGAWKALTDNVNGMAGNLTDQVRNVTEVATAVAHGDLTQKITVDAQGEVLELKNTINTMVDQLSIFASEVTRVAREVGTEGVLGGQAQVEGAGGTWLELINNVNGMASNLTDQVRNIAEVATAVADGDLTQKITVDARGEVLELKSTINTMVDQLANFSAEVTRVAREVGTEGVLGGQAQVEDVAGTWAELTNNVNLMANNLTAQVRNISEVATAVAKGDMTQRITVDAQGEVLELKDTINTMVDQLSIFSAEVNRVAREVGTEGVLGGQAQVEGVAGTWLELTNNVNGMANNLTDQVRNIAEVATAVASGDLTQHITVDAQGEVLELKNTINTMVDQLANFSSEVTRVAREVGTEGVLGGQAQVVGVAGTWRELTNNVNGMANNLTDQVRNIAAVSTAVARGDLSQRITVDAQGEVLELKNTINTMVDQLASFSEEVTRVARDVGTEGILGGQAQVEGVSGTWKDLTDNVNEMADNLTRQVRNIATVATAVANGDLTQKITVDAQGEVLELKNTINRMVDQLANFSAEVTRVAREVGTEGILGGQANVEGVSGTWKDLTDNVNEMADNLTRQVRNIAEVTTAVANGDLTQKITVDARGEVLELKSTINRMVDQLGLFSAEVTRVAYEVGTEGVLGGQAAVQGVRGTWRDLTDAVNGMAGNLTAQVRNIAEVTTAVAEGDLSKTITVNVKGEVLALKQTINGMVEQLRAFSAEVTRLAREVGTEGELGGQATVGGVAGVWKELTDNVNTMADNLTRQVRAIARVTNAVAEGDLTRKVSLEARGEVGELAETINAMTATLAVFSGEVTRVAREVGTEGILGGQANVPGAAGTWRELTDNVNELAGNLTTQVRAIASVATAVTEGDFTKTIEVEARGEVAELSANINEMIRTLRVTTEQNAEQDWLKTNLTAISRALQGQRDPLTVAKLILSNVAPNVDAQFGAFYVGDSDRKGPVYRLFASYGYRRRLGVADRFRPGEGLIGQCATESARIVIHDVPDNYVKISSGLGEASPRSIVVLPIVFEADVKAVMELASFQSFTDIQLSYLEQLADSLGIVLNSIEAALRTEDLLKESQALTEELQARQEELQFTNEELEEQTRLLAEQKAEVERKNAEVEQARVELEEKAAQLSLTSKYKSEFLANMSHELRTPLNSLLVLSQLLAENQDGNLADKQVEYARTIHGSGSELLGLINEILDLSKIESGLMEVEVGQVGFQALASYLRRNFHQVAQERSLELEIEVDPELPPGMRTDERRLQQVLKNLLSNAFKFTHVGRVKVEVRRATDGWSPEHPVLPYADGVVAFVVRDTGIGIPKDKQQVIFEAFQQADGGTSRKYGGTGLGLSISREIAQLLGGEMLVESDGARGSTFTFLLPIDYRGSATEWSRGPRRGDSNPPMLSPPELAEPALQRVIDDRGTVLPGDRVVLLFTDDRDVLGTALHELRSRGYKVVVGLPNEAVRVAVAQNRPTGILLDLEHPVLSGWSVLDRLKRDPRTWHVPVFVLGAPDQRTKGLRLGAAGQLDKPLGGEALGDFVELLEALGRRTRPRLLVVEDDEVQRERLVGILGPDLVDADQLASADAVSDALRAADYDCVILDLILGGASGLELLASLREGDHPRLPVIVYTAKDLGPEERRTLDRLAQSTIVKGVHSHERLLLEAMRHLHLPADRLPEAQRAMLDDLAFSNDGLAGRRVLVVDDDVRNIFALTSVLEGHEMVVQHAENGREAIEILEATDEEDAFDLVLMDIMMPELDGYQTMRAIRSMQRFVGLPIIALTAKAMKGDREKCLEAGASDYITKPVETDALVSMMRVWLAS